jgi:hypothetical protein
MARTSSNARAFIECGYRRDIELACIGPGKPIGNQYVESFNARFRHEWGDGMRTVVATGCRIHRCGVRGFGSGDRHERRLADRGARLEEFSWGDPRDVGGLEASEHVLRRALELEPAPLVLVPASARNLVEQATLRAAHARSQNETALPSNARTALPNTRISD